jgi:hypothetical protein
MCSQQARTTHEALLEDLVNQCGARVALVVRAAAGCSPKGAGCGPGPI